MKHLLFFLSCALLLPLQGNSLIIARGKESNYQIVVQDPTGNKSLSNFIALGGKLLQHTIERSTGAKLPLVTESKRLPGRPAIIIGNTRALAKAGLSSSKFVPWEHAITLRGKDIYIYGKDLPNPLKGMKYPGWFVYYTVGSLKGACVFAERFTNTRFVGIVHNTYGLHDGIRTRPLKAVTVPKNFSYRNKPRFLYNNANPVGGMLYSVANNHYFNCSEEYSVHYHNKALPQAKFAKTNPEFFALINGKRYIHKGDRDGIRPQYCLTNPEVQRRIYQNALDRADQGYTVIEFGQSDGFKGCECAKCKAWYNTSNWGEKLWCFHRDLALRLEKDRPHVTPAISCYGPTHKNLPKSFKKFPTKRMIIDVAPATPQVLEELKKFNITGIAAWTYYFGSYLQSGFSPPRSFRELQSELKYMAKTPVTSFFNCGYATNPALNGPWLYAFGKLCGDRELDTDKLLEEYCLFAFGEKAAKDYVRFFKLIDARIDKYRPPADQDFNNFAKKPPVRALEFWNLRYPPKVLAEIVKAFDTAFRKSDPKNFMVDQLKVEFEYMRLTALTVHAAIKVKKDSSRPNLLKLADALERRHAFIDALPRSKRNPKRIRGYLHNPYESALKGGGSMLGVFGPLFDVSPHLLRLEKKNIAIVKVKDHKDPLWNKLPSYKLTPLKTIFPAIDASFRIAFTDTAILLKCQAPHPGAAAPKQPRDGRLWQNAVWELFISTNHLSRRQMVFTSAPGTYFDCEFFRKKGWLGWNGKWQVKNKVENNIWYAEVTLPFKNVFGRIPRQGERLLMQFAFSPAGGREHYAFNVPVSGAFNDIRGFARVRIGQKPKAPAARDVDINGSFKVKDKKNFPVNWQVAPKRKGTAGVFKDGAVVITQTQRGYAGLYHRRRILLDEKEQCEFTAFLKGSGTIRLGAGWHRGDGDFAVNTSGPAVKLSSKTQRVVWRFECGFNALQKDAWAFQPVIFLNTPGKLIVEKVQIKIIPR